MKDNDLHDNIALLPNPGVAVAHFMAGSALCLFW